MLTRRSAGDKTSQNMRDTQRRGEFQLIQGYQGWKNVGKAWSDKPTSSILMLILWQPQWRRDKMDHRRRKKLALYIFSQSQIPLKLSEQRDEKNRIHEHSSASTAKAKEPR